MTNIEINGQELKVIVMSDHRTREMIVSEVQYLLLQEKTNVSLSLSGLEKMMNGKAPKHKPLLVLCALAKVLKTDLSNFAEIEEKAS